MAERINERIIIISAAVLVVIAVIATIGTAAAQLDNKPFSFDNTPGGGPGMSTGGKQAIINEKLFDATPDNLQRGPGGVLVDVIQGPGDSAITFRHGTGQSMPGFRGSDFRGNNEMMQVGVFNDYFGSMHDSSGFAGYSYAQFHTAAMINTWTMNMVAGPGPSYYGKSHSVDSWTSFVNSLQSF